MPRFMQGARRSRETGGVVVVPEFKSTEGLAIPAPVAGGLVAVSDVDAVGLNVSGQTNALA